MLLLLFFNVYGYFAYIYVCTSHVGLVPKEVKKLLDPVELEL